MFGSFRLGTLFGIPIGVNWTVLFIAWLIAFSLAAQLLPAQVPGLSDAVYWAAGGIAAFLFFGSLLAHELSHALGHRPGPAERIRQRRPGRAALPRR